MIIPLCFLWVALTVLACTFYGGQMSEGSKVCFHGYMVEEAAENVGHQITHSSSRLICIIYHHANRLV